MFVALASPASAQANVTIYVGQDVEAELNVVFKCTFLEIPKKEEEGELTPEPEVRNLVYLQLACRVEL